jgi:hypothetical protein
MVQTRRHGTMLFRASVPRAPKFEGLAGSLVYLLEREQDNRLRGDGAGLIAREHGRGGLCREAGQAVALVSISRQAAKGRSREARRSAAVADSGEEHGRGWRLNREPSGIVAHAWTT